MKKIVFFCIIAGSCSTREYQLNGAYENIDTARDNTIINKMTIFKNGYWVSTSFSGGLTLNCSGGTYKIIKGKCIQVSNFDSQDTTMIGKADTFNINVQNNNSPGEQHSKHDSFRKNYFSEHNLITTKEPLKDSSVEGAWQMMKGQAGYTRNSDEGIRIYAYPAFARVFYNVRQKRFLYVYSGTYQFDGRNLIETINNRSFDIYKGTNIEWEMKRLSKTTIQLFDIDSFYDEEIWTREE